MKWNTVDFEDPELEVVEDGPDFTIEIILDGFEWEGSDEFLNEAEDEVPELDEQERVNKIWGHIGPRIP